MINVNGAPQGSTHRELKTILFADVAEYARLTEKNEDRTHANLCARYSLISNIIRHHCGVIHRTEGDSLLATFTSTSNALQCAIDIQSISSEHNETLSSNEKFKLRIGINCGEVLIDNGEAFGNCVNIAKRLEAFAKPGEIIFSETLFNHVHRKLPYKYCYKGKHRLKNIHKSLKIYSVSLKQNNSVTKIKIFSDFSFKLKSSFLPIFTYAISIFCVVFIAFYIGTEKTNTNYIFSKASQNSKDNHDKTSNNKNSLTIKTNDTYRFNVNESNLAARNSRNYSVDTFNKMISALNNELNTQKYLQNQLTLKYKSQIETLNTLEAQNKKLIAQQEDIRKRFLLVEDELNIKNEQIRNYTNKNRILIEANKNLLTKLDKVISDQALSTYENLYAEYNPVRQQIIDIIESNPTPIENNEDQINCSIYSNKGVKPQTLESINGSVREELFCKPDKNESAPIPQSKLAEPGYYKKEFIPKEKKVVVYAYIPTLPHKTTNNKKIINSNIVNLYKNALADSAFQAYKTNFVLLSPPTDSDDLNSLDSEHCDVYEADYVASVRVAKSITNWTHSSSLVVYNCNSEAVIERNTRHLLSDSWTENGSLYLTPSTLDSFNSQVHSVVDLALNNFTH